MGGEGEGDVDGDAEDVKDEGLETMSQLQENGKEMNVPKRDPREGDINLTAFLTRGMYLTDSIQAC